MPLSLKLEVRSDPQVLSVVRGAVKQFAAVAGFPERDCRRITLAVDEAMTNIIRHAYCGRRDRSIELHCEWKARELRVLLVDRGRPVPPQQIRGRPLGEVRPGGLGVYLITQIMDSVRYIPRAGRNELCLVKRLATRRAGAKEHS